MYNIYRNVAIVNVAVCLAATAYTMQLFQVPY